MLRHSHLYLAFGLGTSLLAATAAAVSMDATTAGWEPLVTLFGSGDKDRAVAQITAMNRAVGISIRNTRREQAVQDFIDDTIDDLSDFDLKDFYRRLPAQSGDFRELAIRGEVRGDAYVIERMNSKEDEVALRGSNNDLAAMSLTLQAKQTRASHDKKAYTLRLRGGVGIGDIGWRDAMAALDRLTRIATLATPTDQAAVQVAAASKHAVKKLHPKLSGEDIEVMALLWEAYPRVSAALSELGRVEDVRTVQTGRSYQQFTLVTRGEPERMRPNYPALASYLEKMDDIAHFDVLWKDRRGRALVEGTIDSESLLFRYRCYVKDGRLLPFRGAHVFEDEPVDPMANEIDATQVLVDARVRLLGVTIKIPQLRLDMTFEPTPQHARLGLTLARVPHEIEVQGAALGFLPTGLIDAFIPGNIEGVARDFLTVAAQSNDGRGMALYGRFGTRDEQTRQGVIEGGVSVDALDNTLIKIGLGMVNERLVPSAAAVEEGKRFAIAVQSAFSKDFARYETHAARASR